MHILHDFIAIARDHIDEFLIEIFWMRSCVTKSFDIRFTRYLLHQIRKINAAVTFVRVHVLADKSNFFHSAFH
ncbi:hypothetical protein D3C72_2271560 [compost metagenome]